ncbi:S-adenosylmethionine sensor upstream of mTORC1 [Ostrinia furnacalis]|uniref:S-adenosylmethionine sensor upstream of mTORC1 n=1 Tax=Ostrinia furnacalis TaxID=93504 RepID=UPI00103E5FB3|nr:S-adenosylmethionine sensor upstream of mTORC1 [Ostrinia furnacalis]
MASEEHKELASYLKNVHSKLRKASAKNGSDRAWLDHCANKDVLETYAHCMEKLATTHWTTNCASDTSGATSRIQWTADFCFDYFLNEQYMRFKAKERNIAEKNNLVQDEDEHFSNPVHFLDVGSCYNPFKVYEYLNVFAIDLCPANNSVLQCDFLNVLVGAETIINNCEVKQMRSSSFEVVAFCYLLEYIPDSNLRILACQKAYSLLKPGGLLIINTPDSKHVGANSKLMKCWRYTLACIGFMRIKYEKFKHMHCMAFRKTLHKDVAIRWATIHKELGMEYAINIPQDFNEDPDESLLDKGVQSDIKDFQELPFCFG